MPKNGMGGGTIVPGKKNIVIPAFTDTELTVRGEPNLVKDNILDGASIFGVNGSVKQANSGSFYIERVTNNTFMIQAKQPPQYIMYGAQYINSGYHGVGFISLALNSDGKGYTRTYYNGHYGQSASTTDAYFYPDANVTVNDDGSITITDETSVGYSAAYISKISGIYG